MEPQNYPSNSKTTRVEKTTERVVTTKPAEPSRPRIEKVVTGTVETRKKSLGARFKDNMFSGADAKTVFGHIVTEVIVPAAQDMIFDAFTQSAERMIFKNTRMSPIQRQAVRNVASGVGTVAYNRMAGTPSASTTIRQPVATARQDPRPQLSHEARRAHNFGEIVLGSRAEAQEVLNQLFAIVEKYDTVSVSELYGLLGIPVDFTDEAWGWENMHGSSIGRARGGGYILHLPRPEPLA